MVPPTKRMVCWEARVTPSLKVLRPAKSWAPVDTRPMLVASAVCKNRSVPTIVAPLAVLD